MPRPQLSFAAEFDGLRSVTLVVKRTQENEFICAPSVGGQLHVTGHGDGSVHLALHDGNQRSYFQKSTNDRTSPYAAVSYVLFSAGCTHQPVKSLTHVTELRDPNESALYQVNYVPSGAGLALRPDVNWRKVGTIPLADGDVSINTCRVTSPPTGLIMSGDGIMASDPDRTLLPPGFLSFTSDEGIFMLFGEYGGGE